MLILKLRDKVIVKNMSKFLALFDELEKQLIQAIFDSFPDSQIGLVTEWDQKITDNYVWQTYTILFGDFPVRIFGDTEGFIKVIDFP